MRALVILLVLLGAIGVGHVAVLWAAPGIIMDRAMAAMKERGIPTHSFRLAPRMTPQTQTVVRPSPDLAYSLCLFDFTRGNEVVRIAAAAHAGYASVSLYDARTDNFATLRDEGEGIDAVLLPPGAPARPGAIVAPSETGVILIRRLAPSEQAYRQVAQIAVQDRCRAVTGEDASG